MQAGQNTFRYALRACVCFAIGTATHLLELLRQVRVVYPELVEQQLVLLRSLRALRRCVGGTRTGWRFASGAAL